MLVNYVSMSEKLYFKYNDLLARMYPNSEHKPRILALLYKLNIPLFRSWNVWNYENRQDFEQDIYLWIKKALENFEPSQGHFVFYLKFYVQKAWNSLIKNHEFDKNNVCIYEDPPFHEETSKHLEIEHPFLVRFDNLPEPVEDHILWKRIKQLCTEDEWTIVRGFIFENQTGKTLMSKLNLGEKAFYELKKATYEKVGDFLRPT